MLRENYSIKSNNARHTHGNCDKLPIPQYERVIMGPFPHSAPKAAITPANPAGTDGFEFVEFAHPEPQALRELFARMG
jgi:hypothetical protein